MDTFKFVVDILSAMASMIAIFTVLIAWYSSIKKPLKVKRVVMHQHIDSSTYILEIENNKSYPVEVKSTKCFTKKCYKVEQMKNFFPTIRDTWSLNDIHFSADENHIIQPCGFTDVIFDKVVNQDQVNELIFLMDTSHGFHSLKCKKIDLVNMEKSRSDIKVIEEHSSWQFALKSYMKLFIKRLYEVTYEKLKSLVKLKKVNRSDNNSSTE